MFRDYRDPKESWQIFAAVIFWIIILMLLFAHSEWLNSSSVSDGDPAGYYQHPGEY